jgi:hypothetical protein
MTQVGEAVKVAVIDDNETPCPFDHEAPKPPKVENDLIGVGGTLARRMKSAKGTHLYADIKDDFPVESILNPKHRPKHPFRNRAKVVEIIAKEGKKTYTHLYPVTCAAHHCIPAQESLKESPLLAYMVGPIGDEEDLKDDSYTGAIVWSDVGYDVNGSENGIFLPGNYAVGGGRGGMGVWGPNVDEDDDEPEDAEDSVPDPKSNELTGAMYQVDEDNRCWQYVRQAMHHCPGQFHDRHEDYSLFVQEVLQKIFANYEALRRKNIDGRKCSKCQDRKKLIDKYGVPTPYGLVARLNLVADRLKGFLDGGTWRINIYTSLWGKAYMETVKKKKSQHAIA